MTFSYGNPVNITPEDEAAGGTPQQLAARAKSKDPNNASAAFNQLANQSIDAQYKLRPDSTFTQEQLDAFNRRQAEARFAYGAQYGQENLQDITTYQNVEDIPRYTEEEIKQMNIERLKANPKSKYNRDKLPQNPAFGEGPKNQKVPQAVVDSYNQLGAKFRTLAETGNQSAVGQQDFDNVLNALRDSPAEYIQPGENYAGPDFRKTDGTLFRDDPNSIFYQDPSKNQQAPAPAGNNQGNLMGNSPSAPAQGTRFDSTAQPAQTSQPPQSVQPAQPAQSVQPGQPAQSVQATQNAQSFQAAQPAQPTPPAPVAVSESANTTPTRRTTAQGNLQSANNSAQVSSQISANTTSAAQTAVERANTRKSNVAPANQEQNLTRASQVSSNISQSNTRPATQDQSQTSEPATTDRSNSRYSWQEARDRAKQKRAERQARRTERQNRRAERQNRRAERQERMNSRRQRNSTSSMDSANNESEFNEEM